MKSKKMTITPSRLYSVMKSGFLRLMLLSFTVSFLATAQADDTSIYTESAADLNAGICVTQERYRFVFIVDNSGSMSSSEFTQSKSTIDATIDYVLNSSGLNDIKVAVMQYGTNNSSPNDHAYDITVPFTNDLATATNWGRQFGSGSPNTNYFQDHLPGSLAEARRDNIYQAGGALDIEDATNVQFVFFTDAWRSWAPYPGDGNQYCCSQLYTNTNDNFKGNSLDGFDEYNRLKDGSLIVNSAGEGIRAQFTVLNTNTDGPSQAAAAAIASPGGSWTGSVEANAGDPEGGGSTPRRYIQGSFAQSDTTALISLVTEVVQEIKETAFTQSSPAVSINAFNQLLNRSELYYAFFEPQLSPRWFGNIKGFSFDLSVDGNLVDQNNQAAVDPATGSLKATSKSYWSDGPYPQCVDDPATTTTVEGLGGCEETTDGSEATVGAFSEHLTATRTVYTQQRTLESVSAGGDYYGGGLLQIARSTTIDPALLGPVTATTSTAVDEIELDFNIVDTDTDGDLLDESFSYSLSANTLTYDDAGNNTFAWTAIAQSDYFASLGANLNASYNFDFSFGQLGTSSGTDFLLVGIQSANELGTGPRRITFGFYFTSGGTLYVYYEGTIYNVGSYAEGDDLSIEVNGTTFIAKHNGSIVRTVNNLDTQSGDSISAGTDFRAIALGYESSLGSGTPTRFSNLRLVQAGIGGTVGTGGITREEVLGWLTGEDVFSENPYSAVTNANQFVADTLHASPLSVTYGGTAGSPTDVLFMTTNLGMLHAIDPQRGTNGGRERWAYVPPSLLDNAYDYIRDDDTQTEHTYGLDARLSSWVQRTGTNITPDQVFLYTGQRRGGRNIYAFNATNAATGMSGFTLPSGAKTCGTYGDGAATDPVCLLFRPIEGGTTAGFDQLGETWSDILVEKIQSCAGSVCTEKDVLIFSGGYDDEYDTTTNPSSLANTVKGNHIYMVDALTGALLWSAGRTNPAITGDEFLACDGANTSTCANEMSHSFVGVPSVLDLDFNGTIDTMFAVDVIGQVWRFDFRETSNGVRPIQNSTGGIIARLNSGSSDRYFYNSLDVALIRESENEARINISVASGRRPQPTVEENQSNEIFSVYDYNLGLPPALSGTSAANSYKYVAGSPSRVIAYTDLSVLDISETDAAIQLASIQGDYGFRLDMPANYEKFLSRTLTKNSRIVAVSYIPENGLGSATQCAFGQNKLYVIDLLLGGIQEDSLVQTGIAPGPVVITSAVNGEITHTICLGTECIPPCLSPPCNGKTTTKYGLDNPNIGVPEKTKWFETGLDGTTHRN